MDEDILMIKKWLKRAAVSLAVLTVLLGCFTVVGVGERAVVVRFGHVERTLDQGFHLKAPLVDDVKKFDVRVTKTAATASAASKDLQTVAAEIALNWRLQPEAVAALYQEIGNQYEERIIAPSLQEAVKAATASYTAEELITKRQQVKDEIKSILAERLSKSHIVVTDVNIVNFDFSDSFNAAIEAKVTAEQNALASKNKLEQVKYEAEQRVAQAQAEATAIKIQAEALKDNKGLAELEAVKKWNGVLPSYVGGTIPFLNLK